jgi:hypothetical protein
MTRSLSTLVLLAMPAILSAQDTVVPIGPTSVGGRVVTGPPIVSTNGESALYPVETYSLPAFTPGGGSLSGPLPMWMPSGKWGAVAYAWPETPVMIIPEPVKQPSAKLVIEFPFAGRVWVNGLEVAGEAKLQRMLIVPATTKPQDYLVTAVWETGGKTYTSMRTVTLSAETSQRWIIVSGAEVKSAPPQ